MSDWDGEDEIRHLEPDAVEGQWREARTDLHRAYIPLGVCFTLELTALAWLFVALVHDWHHDPRAIVLAVASVLLHLGSTQCLRVVHDRYHLFELLNERREDLLDATRKAHLRTLFAD